MHLETSRLILRPWEDRDRTPLKAIMGDAHVMRFYERPMTEAEIDAEIDGSWEKAEQNGFHSQAAELRETGELVGLLGLSFIPERTRAVLNGNPPIEIGWLFGSPFWGRGLAPEGAAAFLEHAWSVLDLSEVVAFTAAINRPSQRVMEKLGMTRAPTDDFRHPKFAADHPLAPHVLYRIANPAAEGSTPVSPAG